MAKTTTPAQIPTPTPTPEVSRTPTPTPVPELITFEPEDIQAAETSIIMKVENLRAKGFDNNRIAATLMIHKHIVDSI